jgi:hypothetical protein
MNGFFAAEPLRIENICVSEATRSRQGMQISRAPQSRKLAQVTNLVASSFFAAFPMPGP